MRQGCSGRTGHRDDGHAVGSEADQPCRSSRQETVATVDVDEMPFKTWHLNIHDGAKVPGWGSSPTAIRLGSKKTLKRTANALKSTSLPVAEDQDSGGSADPCHCWTGWHQRWRPGASRTSPILKGNASEPRCRSCDFQVATGQHAMATQFAQMLEHSSTPSDTTIQPQRTICMSKMKAKRLHPNKH